MDLHELRKLCLHIDFGDTFDPHWTLKAEEEGDSFWLQWVFSATDRDTGEMGIQHGRKWRISRYCTPDEVVKTAFAGVLMAIEHEARERFTYKGQPVFHPHTDVEALVELQRQKRHVRRKEKV